MLTLRKLKFTSYVEKVNGMKRFSTKIEDIFTKQKLYEFNEKGYAVLPNVFTSEKMDELKEEMKNILEKADENEIKYVFNSSHEQDNTYFSESGDKIRFFLENDALDENRKIKYPINRSLNKVGHALHDLNEIYEKFSYSKEVNFMCKMLGLNKPIIAQSMYIFKNNYIGGKVRPHADNTYIRTTPGSCKGLWIALDDVTLQNGCLWGVPGSHKKKCDYLMSQHKNPDGTYEITYNKDTPEYSTEGCEPLPVKRGTVVLLHGDMIHFSHKNESNKQRHAYTLHIVESKDTKWDKENWIIRDPKMPFRFVYETFNQLYKNPQ